MITGNLLFFGLFNNLAFFIILVAIYGVLIHHLDKSNPIVRQVLVGLIFGVLTIACMHVRIPVAEGVIVDQRNTVVALCGAFGGPLSAILCALMAASYRVYLGGAGVFAGVIGICLSMLSGTVFYLFREKVDTVGKALFCSFVATNVIILGFLFYKDLHTGWELLKAMALPYGSAVFLGMFFLGLLLAHQEKSYSAQIELKRSERRYRESEQHLDLALEAANEGIWDWDIENNRVYFDQRYYEIAGYSPGDFPAAYGEWEKRVHPDDLGKIKPSISQYLAGELSNYDVEFRFLRKDGDYMWVQGKGRIVAYNDQGEPIRFVGIHADITPRKLMEQQQRFNQLAFDKASIGIFQVSPDGEIVNANDRACRSLGYSIDELIRLNLEDIDPSYFQEGYRNIREKLDRESSLTFETFHQRKDGSTFPVEITVNRHEFEGERVSVSFQTDITARKQLEESLLTYRFVFENAAVSILRIASDAKIIEVNRKAAEMLGYKRDEMIGMSIFEIDPTVSEGNWSKIWHALRVQNMDSFETTHRHKDGHRFPVEVNSNLLQYGGQDFAISLVQDITNRKEAADALQKSQKLYQEAQQIAQLGYWERNVGDDCLIWSDEMFRIFEIEKTSSGVSFDAFLERVHPEDRIHIDEHINRAIENRTRFDTYNRILLPDNRVKYVHGMGNVEYDNNGNPLRLIGTVQDVTKLKEAEIERERSEQKLLQAQKLEAIGTLSGGIAHDFNNILAPIIGFTQLSIAELSENNKTREYLEQVLQAGLRARDLVTHILSFSRQSEFRVEVIQVHLIIGEVTKLLRASIPANIEIDQNISSPCCPVLADPIQMHQVIMNLCTNSYHAIGNRNGRITISLEEAEIGLHDFPEISDLQIGKHAKLVVSDTGHGMDQATLEKIFDPYFTTKNKSEGTGLGLAVVHGIVKTHGGHINVYSELGHGTSFIIYLPCATDQNKNNRHEASTEVPGGNEHIILVDDERPITNMMKELLNRMGYRVSAFNDADKAIDFYISQPEAVDLIITDMTMPGMSGEELTRCIHETDQQVPIIIQTGFSDDLDAERLQSLGVGAVLRKPVLEMELAQCIRKVIDQKDT